MQRAADVIIVGAGAIGLAIAWRAAARGLRVTVLERHEPGEGTTRFAAGMIAPVSEAAASEPALLELGRHSARAYPAFVQELTDSSGIDPLYQSCGTLLLARDRDEAEALRREQALRDRLELPTNRLRPTDARALEPALAPTLRSALEIPDDHAIDPRLLARALAAAAERAGAELHSGAEVAGLIADDDRVSGVTLKDGTRHHAAGTVIAAGPWSAQLPGLPESARVPMRPVKGQIIGLRDPAGPGLVTRVLRMQPGYLVPRGDGRYALGATVEERGFDTTVTAGAIHELLRDATELVPGLSELTIEELGAGIRPGTPDNLPIIGPGAVDGLQWATGHYRNGILLAPITAELVAGELAGEPDCSPASPLRTHLDPRRFELAGVR